MDIKEQISSFKKMVNGYKLTYIIMAAKKLRIFENLTEVSISSEELSKKINLEKSRIEPLLNSLVYYKLISRDENGYYLQEYKEILSLKSETNQLGYVDLAESLIDKYKNLHLAVQDKNISNNNFEKFTQQEAESFMKGMEANAIPQVKYILNNYNFSNRNILDIGAGSGIYLASIAKNDETVKGKMLDLQEMVKIQKRKINEFNISDRVVTQVCDYNKEFPTENYDDIFLFAIAHQEPKENLAKLLKNIYNILNPNGRLFLTSFFLNDDKLSPEFSVQFSIEMLVNSNNGRVYTHAEIRELLEKTGFNKIDRVDDIPGPATLYVITK